MNWRQWFVHRDDDRDPNERLFAVWGINHRTLEWEINGERGHLPELPSIPVEQWPRRFRDAVKTLSKSC